MTKPPKWEKLSESLRDEFKKRFDFIKFLYFDGTNNSSSLIYNDLTEYIDKAEQNKSSYQYPEVTQLLFNALDKYNVKNKSTVIFGSQSPWYESIALAKGCSECTTIEYNKIICKDKRLKVLTVAEYESIPDENKPVFDVGFSISSFEHDGLGRYGDPVNPDGDIKAMQNAKKMIKKDGILFLAVPCNQMDVLVYNAHRIYGPKCLKELINGWGVIGNIWHGKNRFT